jgi:hypothetical protein
LNPFVPDISQHSEKLIPRLKKRRTPLEKKNLRTGREIKDLLVEEELKNRARNQRSSLCIKYNYNYKLLYYIKTSVSVFRFSLEKKIKS